MGLGNFFKRVSSGISNVAGKAWAGAKNVGGKVWEGVKYIGKAAKPVINVAQKITGLTEKIPGMIGEASKWVRGGLDKVNDWIGMIPDGKIKDKLKEASDDVGGLVDRGEDLARHGGEAIAGGINQTKPWVDFAGKLIGGKLMAIDDPSRRVPKTAENSIQSNKPIARGLGNWMNNGGGHGSGINAIRNMGKLVNSSNTATNFKPQMLYK